MYTFCFLFYIKVHYLTISCQCTKKPHYIGTSLYKDNKDKSVWKIIAEN